MFTTKTESNNTKDNSVGDAGSGGKKKENRTGVTLENKKEVI
jgi:hypothetical protein